MKNLRGIITVIAFRFLHVCAAFLEPRRVDEDATMNAIILHFNRCADNDSYSIRRFFVEEGGLGKLAAPILPCPRIFEIYIAKKKFFITGIKIWVIVVILLCAFHST